MRGEDADGPALPWLVADIGGTNARFGWVAGPSQQVEHVAQLPVADHAGVAQAAVAYLGQLADRLGSAYGPPRKAALAVATAIVGDAVDLTNSRWSFSRSALQAELGVRALVVLNDFEALALSLPRLSADQLRFDPAWPGRAVATTDTRAVVGPGTGLGVGAVVRAANGWVALPGEGGHATLAAADDFESELLALVRRHHDHVSAERLLSGIGLPVLHAAVAELRGQTPAALSAQDVVERGRAGTDAACVATLDTFCALLGAFAGNVALTFGARGGVYIGGGIVPRLGDLFFASRFRQRFEAKGRFRSYLAAIPTPLITDTLAALAGATVALAQHRQ